MKIQCSYESTTLETGCDIKQALPTLGYKPFWVINGDVFIYAMPEINGFDSDDTLNGKLAHPWLVDNPSQLPKVDFPLKAGL